MKREEKKNKHTKRAMGLLANSYGWIATNCTCVHTIIHVYTDTCIYICTYVHTHTVPNKYIYTHQ